MVLALSPSDLMTSWIMGVGEEAVDGFVDYLWFTLADVTLISDIV